MRVPDRRPAIMVHHAGHPAALRAVLAGIEEEGVPARVMATSPDAGARDDAVALAYRAACQSALGVGVGVDVDGTVCVHHNKLAEGEPARVSTDPAHWRNLGHDAARIVKIVPLCLE